MNKILLFTVLMTVLASGFSQALTFHFASIDGLVEQEVGGILLPQIYAQINEKMTVTRLPANRAENEATTGNADGEILRIYAYGESNSRMHRVPTPYYYLESMAFFKKGRDITIEQPADLCQYAIAKVRGVKHSDQLAQGCKNVIDLNSTKQIMMFVDMGRVDIALTSTLDGQSTIERYKLGELTSLSQPIARFDLYHYLHDYHRDMVDLIDQQILKMKASGELKRLIIDAEAEVRRSRSQK